ncbi:MAG: 2-keto-4-pentenoate hydratase/2-oxohepta-3-ene-1,7-dioic acid hydratase in catechol pathway [Gammaproteobacteria bacterium]|jgi:2-keto-4-pentenoate hydratase/2-oxohepta-3-ene-1,7-dioic acid hydratase in catechol pathway
MKLVSFSDRGGPVRVGVLDDVSNIVDCTAVDKDFPSSMLELICAGADGIGQVKNVLEVAPNSARISQTEVQLVAPIPRPTKNVFCVGRNYKEHVEEGHRTRGTEIVYPQAPQFFTKAPTAVIGPNETASLDPRVTQMFDYEAELGIVIGSGGINIAEADAEEAIFGYTIVNDFTARDLQRHHDQWFKGKSLDRSCAIGPCIVHKSAIGNPQDLGLELTVNGEQRQASRTSYMIFSIAKIIRDLSLGMTLEPGDIIATGTPKGVGFAMDPQRFLADGDEIVIKIEGIGQLRNCVEQVTTISKK